MSITPFYKNSLQSITTTSLILLSVITFGIVVNFITSKTVVEQNDVYGKYSIDNTMFAGKQANWQKQHFEFEITKDDTLRFYVLNNGKKIRTDKRKIIFTNTGYVSALWKFNLENDSLTHHCISSTPILYRYPFKFRYVFLSKKYNNMYFVKKRWFE
ncbi:MAG: hypothetical protein ABL940_08985 [Bacteroidia bacterium]